MNRGNYMKSLKEICRGIAKTLGFIQDADKKIASNMSAALKFKAEQAKEYEKRFEPGPPEPDPMQEAAAQVGVDVILIANALQEFADALHRPEPVVLANNWRKMHGLPMRRKRKRRK